MKTFFKYVKRTTLVLLSCIVSYVLIALLLSYWPISGSQKNNCTEEQVSYITTNGVHVDIIFPLSSIPEKHLKNLKYHHRAKYLAFGWGDRDFYLNTPKWEDLTFNTAFSALFLKSESLMHVTEYGRKYAHWKPVPICTEQMIALQNHVFESFKLNSGEDYIVIPGATYNGHDKFYEAFGSYNCLYTCNTWVNAALKKSDIKTAVWTPFDFGILNHLD